MRSGLRAILSEPGREVSSGYQRNRLRLGYGSGIVMVIENGAVGIVAVVVIGEAVLDYIGLVQVLRVGIGLILASAKDLKRF
jgi:hypothetical protein